MMSSPTLRPYAEAIANALEVQALLQPACEKLVIAGSLRRLKTEVKDIEIVAIAKTQCVEDDLFGGVRSISDLDALLPALVSAHKIAYDLAVPRNGTRYKRLLYGGMSVDLFIAEEDNFGNILAIRTGSAIFSQFLMVRAKSNGYAQKDGYLYTLRGNHRHPCPTEEEYFRACGVAWVDPPERTEETAREMGWK